MWNLVLVLGQNVVLIFNSAMVVVSKDTFEVPAVLQNLKLNKI